MEANEKVNVRFVTVRGVRYLRVEDVTELLLEFAATEETDVRDRMDVLVRNILKKETGS